MKITFAHNLKFIRERYARLSQAELAEKIGLPASSISHFESGGRLPSLKNFAKLCSALNTRADILLFGPKETAPIKRETWLCGDCRKEHDTWEDAERCCRL